MRNWLIRTTRLLAVAFGIPLLAACGDDDGVTPPDQDAGTELAVVLNSVERSLSAFPVDTPSAGFVVGLGPDGSPASMAVHGNLAVVPMGTYPYAVVVDLASRTVEHTVPLPEGSGATGVAFVSDTLALVANMSRNTVTPVNVKTGTAGEEIEVGVFPHAIVATASRAYVLNGEMEDYKPVRTGTITVIDTETLAVVDTIQLSGYNPGSAVLDPNGLLYVLNSGKWGAADGSLSVVDLVTGKEVAHHEGFGEFPSVLAGGPDGRLYVTSYSYGIAVWDPATATFAQGPGEAIQIGDGPVVSAMGFDSRGRTFVIKPGNCIGPGAVLRLDDQFAVEQSIEVGVCPVGITFTEVAGD